MDHHEHAHGGEPVEGPSDPRDGSFLQRLRARVQWLRWRLASGPRAMERFARDQLWRFDTDLERGRHARVLRLVEDVVGPAPWGRALEVGCFAGDFTSELAPRCAFVDASDVSATACVKAAARCASLTNVRVERRDLMRGGFPGGYDLVFAMDVLESMHGAARLGRAAAVLAAALRPGGILVVTSVNPPFGLQREWWARRLVAGADNIVDFLGRRDELEVLARETYPGQDRPEDYLAHVIALYRRVPSTSTAAGAGASLR